LPGVLLLAKTLDVSKDAMREALHLLEAEGLISAGHAGANRMVLDTAAEAPRRAMRVAILPHDPLAKESDVMRELLHATRRELEVAGHTVAIAAKSLSELRFDLERIANLMAATPADAWVVAAAPPEVLEFFAAQAVPAIALGGRCTDVAMASVYADLLPGYREATRRLLALGHRRIVLMGPTSWRQPTPNRLVRAFTEEMAAHGITVGDFNVPDYEATTDGLRAIFESLFRLTPPTALILELAEHVTAALVFLAQHGLSVPRDVSLMLPYASASLQLCDPPIAHLHYDERLLVRRIVRWVRAVARDRADRDAIGIPASFDPGGTIGPVRQG
jgi:DNA-binding LacI/PurR family transcriptional regulator